MDDTTDLTPSLRLHDMPAETRPRERLQQLGVDHMTDYELLAILLRVGIKGTNAVQMAREILENLGGMRQIAQRAPDDLLMELNEVAGIGPAKACQIVAAIELGRRVERSKLKPDIDIDFSDVLLVKQYVSAFLRYNDTEVVWLLVLDTHKKLKAKREVFRGTHNETYLSPREVYGIAFRLGASSIILAHNHPSGDPEPSAEDVLCTKQLKKAGEVLGIPLVDHIIVGDPDVISMRCYGYL